MKNICPKCGKPRLDNEVECPYCGIVYAKFKKTPPTTQIKNPLTQTSIQPIPKIDLKHDPEFPPISKKAWIGLFLIIGSGLLFYVSKILGSIAIICSVSYLVKEKGRNHVTIKSAIKTKNAMKVDVSPYRFLGENIPDIVFKIKSSSQDTEYFVNPKNQTCTCPNFVDFRSKFEYGDVRRFCKHLMKAFCRKKVFNFLPDYLKPLVLSAKEQGKGAFKEQLLITNLNQQTILLSFNDRNAWHSVYTKDDTGNFDRYGFNTEEDRWSYENIPKNHAEISAVICAMRDSGKI